MKSSGRLFTFGCSMTKYNWPTWADILGQQWEYYENWGEPGAGNNYIFNSVIECDTRNKFSSQDTVLIMWSGVARIDYYNHNQWGHMVNKFTKDALDQPLSCPDGYEIISYALFAALDQYLSSKNINYKMCSFIPYDSTSRSGLVYHSVLNKIKYIKFNVKQKKVKKLVSDSEIQSLYSRLRGKDWPTLEQILEKNFICVNQEINEEIQQFIHMIETDPYYKTILVDTLDYHPLPIDHYTVLDQIYPVSNVSQETIDFVNNITSDILAGNNYYFNRNLPRERL
jgi:hypothetical protein